MNEFDKIHFPIVKNVMARSLADDIKPFDPNNPQHVNEWKDMFKNMYENLKKEFDKKGIPFPEVVIDTTPGPITYGIKTTDASGKILHTLINNDNK